MKLLLPKKVHQIVMILAAYGIIQVLAQDLGIKTGKKQRDLIQSYPTQAFFLFAGAYTIVGEDHVGEAAIATGLYYFLKYILSNGETSEVCFEDV